MITLDTNTLIYYLRDELVVANRIEQWKREQQTLFISTITELEVFSLSSLSQNDMETIDALISSLVIVPVDSQIARKAAELRRKHSLRTPDSAIAATTLITASQLATRDIKHFAGIPELKLIEI